MGDKFRKKQARDKIESQWEKMVMNKGKKLVFILSIYIE